MINQVYHVHRHKKTICTPMVAPESVNLNFFGERGILNKELSATLESFIENSLSHIQCTKLNMELYC
jgi:hypothetical protein